MASGLFERVEGTERVPELTLGRMFTEWTLDPAVAFVVVVLAAWYVRAVRKVDDWPVSRTVNFLGLGLGSIVLATMSFVGAYDDTLFWCRALQVITLLAISPLFLANGAPLTLLLATLRTPERAERLLKGRAAGLLTFPPVGTALLVATPWVLYFTPLYEAVLRGTVVDEAVTLAILVIGFVYFWARLQIDPLPREYPHVVSMGITFAEAMFDGALGITLIFMAHPLASSYYDALNRTWGPSQRMDQVIGGGILWMIGDLAGLPFLGSLFIRMFRQDRKEAARIDQELDAKAPVTEEGPEMMRPWWLDDPILSKRYREQP